MRSQLADEDLKEDGKTLRDIHPTEWAFSLGMLQVMQNGRREDKKHTDGGASLLHLGLSLFGRRSREALAGRSGYAPRYT